MGSNFHKSREVSVPKQIYLSQLVRWVCFGVVPLPEAIETELCHLPIYDDESQKQQLQSNGDRCLEFSRITKYLAAGKLVATGVLQSNRSQTQIDKGFWTAGFANINWTENTASTGEFPWEYEEDSTLSDLQERYGSTTYTEISFETADVAHLFDLQQVVDAHDFGFQKEAKKNPKGAGRKQKFKWFELIWPEIVMHVHSQGFPDNQTTMADAVYHACVAKYGEKDTPEMETIRTEAIGPLYKRKSVTN